MAALPSGERTPCARLYMKMSGRTREPVWTLCGREHILLLPETGSEFHCHPACSLFTTLSYPCSSEQQLDEVDNNAMPVCWTSKPVAAGDVESINGVPSVLTMLIYARTLLLLYYYI
jgi:hypothetical protein